MSSLFIATAVLVAVIAFFRARAAAKRFDRLSESYWELRYEVGQLRSRVTRLEVAAGLRDAEPDPAAAPAASTTTFVPLASLRK